MYLWSSLLRELSGSQGRLWCCVHHIHLWPCRELTSDLAVAGSRSSFLGLLPQRPIFVMRSVNVRFVAEKLLMRRVCPSNLTSPWQHHITNVPYSHSIHTNLAIDSLTKKKKFFSPLPLPSCLIPDCLSVTHSTFPVLTELLQLQIEWNWYPRHRNLEHYHYTNLSGSGRRRNNKNTGNVA
jgi:hypothetical protein